jgi:sec-independent protein translocase protein TatA
LALVGYEWLIVVGVILVIFIWGPQKLPELARSIGLAKKEFDKAAKEGSATASETTAATAPSSGTVSSNGDPLIVAAKSLGISTEGKTKEEIAKEIAERSTKK